MATSRAPSASQGPQQEAAPRRRDCLASGLGPSGHTEAPVLLPNARFSLIFQGKAQPRDRTLGAGQRGEGGDAYGGLTSAASQPFPHDTGLRSRRRSQSPLFLCALPAWGRRLCSLGASGLRDALDSGPQALLLLLQFLQTAALSPEATCTAWAACPAVAMTVLPLVGIRLGANPPPGAARGLPCPRRASQC